MEVPFPAPSAGHGEAVGETPAGETTTRSPAERPERTSTRSPRGSPRETRRSETWSGPRTNARETPASVTTAARGARRVGTIVGSSTSAVTKRPGFRSRRVRHESLDDERPCLGAERRADVRDPALERPVGKVWTESLTTCPGLTEPTADSGIASSARSGSTFTAPRPAARAGRTPPPRPSSPSRGPRTARGIVQS